MTRHVSIFVAWRDFARFYTIAFQEQNDFFERIFKIMSKTGIFYKFTLNKKYEFTDTTGHGEYPKRAGHTHVFWSVRRPAANVAGKSRTIGRRCGGVDKYPKKNAISVGSRTTGTSFRCSPHSCQSLWGQCSDTLAGKIIDHRRPLELLFF